MHDSIGGERGLGHCGVCAGEIGCFNIGNTLQGKGFEGGRQGGGGERGAPLGEGKGEAQGGVRYSCIRVGEYVKQQKTPHKAGRKVLLC